MCIQARVGVPCLSELLKTPRWEVSEIKASQGQLMKPRIKIKRMEKKSLEIKVGVGGLMFCLQQHSD